MRIIRDVIDYGVFTGGSVIGLASGYIGGNYILNQTLKLMEKQISDIRPDSPESLMVLIPIALAGCGAVLGTYINGAIKSRFFRDYRK